ncbi:hypothetical protein RDI58_000199 [Solanum bulbocastanum]|uniref:Uncharacterized protein n=1 Tax=Solanum bulbocastanum TaxID=147425 RepID=A0AAN8U2Y7_SOLBU
MGILPSLMILKLRSNKFHGPIKTSRTGNLFDQLQITDLSSNGFSGNLPESLSVNLHAMKKIDENMIGKEILDYDDSLTITTKGLDLTFARVLWRNSIVNRFEGPIPNIIGHLIGLRVLNLPHNVLEGHIPASLQNLSVLKSLDLSSNKINGEVPQQLISLTFSQSSCWMHSQRKTI